MSGRLLIIAAEFPPVKGIGRLRPLKFCQHLIDHGWETAVLTPEAGDIAPVDPRTLQEIPAHTSVYRAPLPQPKRRAVAFLKSALKRDSPVLSGAGAAIRPLAPGNGHPALQGDSLPGRLLGAWDRFARMNLLIPDDMALWSGPAVRKGIQAVREFKPDVILATAPYFTDLLVGARLSRATGIPWIADYRDLWTGDVLRAWVPAWRRHLEVAMERRVLAGASAVITVSEPKTQVMRERLAGVNAGPFVTLTNGYDPEEFDGIAPERGQEGVFRIVYAGRLFKNRRGYELLEAAGALLRGRPEYRGRLRIEYYGGVSPDIAARMQELIRQHDLVGVVTFFPDVAYERSKALQKGADALLLIVDVGETTSGVIPGKLFEYVAAARPILCIAEPGATTEIIERGRLGVALRPGDVDGLSRALDAFLTDAGKPPSFDVSFLAQFERGKIVQRLSTVLESVPKRRQDLQ